ncbi:MAG: hypothetical protein Q9223_005475 [Gallowayella weberi]
MPPPTNLANPLQARSDWAALAIYQPDCYHWTVNVTLGTQVLNLVVDTGSSDLWVYSPLVKNPQNHTLYDYRKSPNSHYIQQAPAPGIAPVNATFDIGYEFQGSHVQGLVVNEVVSLAGVPSVPMNIEVATEVSDAVKNVKCWDGVIGMGFGGLNTVPDYLDQTPALSVPPGQENEFNGTKAMLTPSSVKPVPQDSYLERLLNESATSPNPPTLPVFTVDGNPKRAGSKPTFEIGRIDREKANGYLQVAAVNNTEGWWAVENIAFEAGYDIDHHPGHNLSSKHGMIFGKPTVSTLLLQSL